jgi:hypothetical protein
MLTKKAHKSTYAHSTNIPTTHYALPGFCDALGLGSSTKAAVIRRGLQETMDYCNLVAGDEFKVG